jgi:polyisoprenoid-binding protein YceI
MSTGTASETAAFPAGKFKIDAVHSTVGFEVKHIVSTFRGAFGEYDARLENTNGAPRLVGSAQVASVDVRDENLSAHLQSPDFFDGERHPEVRFASERFELSDDGSVSLDGDLTIRGITRPMHASGRYERTDADLSGAGRVGLDLETAVDRREFGIVWNAPLPKGGFVLGNDVKLVIHLELVQEEA